MADDGAFKLGGYTEEELAGLGLGDMTPMTRAGMAGDTISTPDRGSQLRLELSRLLGIEDPGTIAKIMEVMETPAKEYSTQLGRAADAGGRLVEDPSLATATNAALQTGGALAATHPMAGIALAGGGMGAGLGIGAGLDALGYTLGSDSAAAEGPSTFPKVPPPLPENRRRMEAREAAANDAGAARQERLELARIKAKAEADAKIGATKAQADADNVDKEKARQDAEIKRRALVANEMRQKVLDRSKWKDTYVGSIIEEAGGAERGGVGALAGLATHLATPKLGPFKRAAATALAGAGGGISPGYWEQIWKSRQPTMHPEREAALEYEKYADPRDPAIATVRDVASRYPEKNPDSVEGKANLLSPYWNAQNAVGGVMEGVTGALGAGHASDAVAAGARALPAGVDLTTEVLGRMARAPGKIARDFGKGFMGEAKKAPTRRAKTPVKTGASADSPPKKPTSTQANRTAGRANRREWQGSLWDKKDPKDAIPDGAPKGHATKTLNALQDAKSKGYTKKQFMKMLDDKKIGIGIATGAGAAGGLPAVLEQTANDLEKDKS